MLKSIISVVLLIIIPFGLQAQLQVTEMGESQSADSLVKTCFAGDGIKIIKTRYKGHNEAIGSFEDPANHIGFGKGLALATGRVELIAGRNTKPNTSTNFGDAFFKDKHLITRSSLCDGAVLEIDFIPQKDSITLSFIFGSEEYPEFVSKEFNDVVRILIQPLFIKSAKPKNIARLADKSPVGLNTVNRELHPGCYIDNTSPSGIFYNHLEFDGFTTPLAAGARVAAGKPYRLKVMIVDLEDCEYDSGILLDAFSFRSLSSKPKRFKAATKNYFLKLNKLQQLTNGSVIKLNRLCDSLNRFSYDSLLIRLDKNVTDSNGNELIHKLLSECFTERNLKSNKIIIQPAESKNNPALMVRIEVTAYRKPQ